MVAEERQVDEMLGLPYGSLDEMPGGRVADEKNGEAVDPECPREADLLDQLLEREGQRDTAKGSAGIDDSIGGSPTQEEILRGDDDR